MCDATWHRQFSAVLNKNRKLFQRRFVHQVILILSSVVSVLLAWLVGRDANGPQAEFPILTECGQVDPLYYASFYDDFNAISNIPVSLNEPWRGGLPVWLMSLGPTASAISAFLILRDEFTSRRWGTLRSTGLMDSAHWMAWLVPFVILGMINSLAGAATAVALPDVHVFANVNFASIFSLLQFLNLSLVAASFFMVAICGTAESMLLTMILIIGIICAGSAPFIAAATQASMIQPTDSSDTYQHKQGTAGAFWAYGSTARARIEYPNSTWDNVTFDFIHGEPLVTKCQVPIVSHDQGQIFKTQEERELLSRDEIFMGCYIIRGASATFVDSKVSFLFWYFFPQTHFMLAWSNILGYTSFPGSEFTMGQASKSPEVLAKESLMNYNGGVDPLYNESNTYGTSLFPQGSTVGTEVFNYFFPVLSSSEPMSNCPSTNLIPNLCNNYEGATCSSLLLNYPTISSPSFNDCIGFLASLVAIYCVLASYLSAVLPMGNGSALKFYFFLQPSFWCGHSSTDHFEHIEGAVEIESDDVDRFHVGVEFFQVAKSYGTVEALKPLSLKLNIGEVTSFLGHNGAGKSTLARILCCEENPSSGDIFVFKKSVRCNPYNVRKIIGVCRQDDFLWPDLSAKDHLELFAGIRGVDSDKVTAVVQTWLESVDLDSVKDCFTSSFSGGMKRRLSVAISTIGPSKVIVLDEPTTGMDPISRRLVWNHITTIKPGRVILLTTHAMEEADLLSDSVAILCGGTLAECGSPLELKTKYGSAVQFSIITTKENVGSVEEYIKNHFDCALDWISLESSTAGHITLNVKKIQRNSNEDGLDASSLATFIDWLEFDETPVQEFSISNSSLQEVFLAVTKYHHSEFLNSTSNMNPFAFCCCCRRKKRGKMPTREFISSHSDESTGFTRLPPAKISEYSRDLSLKTQAIAIFRFYMERNWTGRASTLNWAVFGFFCGANMLAGFSIVQVWPYYPMYYILLVTVSLLSMILISIISPVYTDRNAGLFKMMSTQSMLKKSFLLGTSLYSWVVSLIYTFVTLTLFFGTKIYRDIKTPSCALTSYPDKNQSYTEIIEYQCGYAHFGDNPVVHPYNRFTVLTGEHNGSEVTVYAAQRAGSYLMIIGIIIVFSMTFPGAVLSCSFLPGFRIPLVGVSILLLVACVSPAVLYTSNIFSPQFSYDCAENIKNTHNCDSYSFSLENVNRTFVECVGFQVTNPGVYCSPSVASILPQIGLFQSLSLTLMSDIVFFSEPEEYIDDIFMHSLKEASCSGNTCSFSYARKLYMESLAFMLVGASLLLVLGFCITYSFLYPHLFIINSRQKFAALLGSLDSVNKVNSGSEESRELVEVDYERRYVATTIQPILTSPEGIDANEFATSSISYKARNNVQNQLPAVITYRLRKVFPSLSRYPPTSALDSLDLHVPYGQVLGLLGKNGAGKTTTLKILTGLDDASSGIGLVAGYDVAGEILSVYEQLGNCPQLDVVWKNQSVQSHLEFYARLKGVKNPLTAAKEIATAVGLGAPDVYIKLSKHLSGGMRRRLSIAVALIGSPKILCLDEPTTGLDPLTKHEIWGLISSFTSPYRAVIITTHMMIEADTLCSRIAILSKGKLKVIGTQQHLKDFLNLGNGVKENYGSGYLLQLNLVNSSEQSVHEALKFVRENIDQDAKIIMKQAKTIGFNLPTKVRIQNIFTIMYSKYASDVGINQFLLSQSSLEDVFVALG